MLLAISLARTAQREDAGHRMSTESVAVRWARKHDTALVRPGSRRAGA